MQREQEQRQVLEEHPRELRNTEREIALTRLRDALGRVYQLPPRYVLTFEELQLVLTMRKSLPQVDEQGYQDFHRRFTRIRRAIDKRQLEEYGTDQFIITEVCPRALYHRINTVVISNGMPPIPTAGHPRHVRNYPTEYLAYTAFRIGAANITGLTNSLPRHIQNLGTYISRMSWLYENALQRLVLEFHFNMDDRDIRAYFDALVTEGRILAKTPYQHSIEIYSAEKALQLHQKRTRDYLIKFDEFMKIGLKRYQSRCAEANQAAISAEAFMVTVGRLVKLLTEYSISDFPLPSKRVRLVRILSGGGPDCPLNGYLELLGKMFYHGVITPDHARVFDQGDDTIQQASMIADNLREQFGEGQAIYHNHQNRGERINLFHDLDQAHMIDGEHNQVLRRNQAPERRVHAGGQHPAQIPDDHLDEMLDGVFD